MEDRLRYIGKGEGDSNSNGNGSGSCSGSGYGSGYGDGSGSGYGSGSGHGYGSGYSYGDGHGSGNGSGSGSGYGYGSGYGDGSGSGSGYGSGYGYGDGSGSGDGKHIRIENVAIDGEVRRVEYIDGIPTIITQRNGNYMRGYIVNTQDFTLTPCHLAIVGSSIAHGDTLHNAVVDATSKEIEKIPVSKKIERFVAFFPTLDTEATVEELYNWHGRLTGSCRFGRDEFIRSLPNKKDKYTIGEFINLTIYAYGGNVIRQLKEKYYETTN